MQIVMAVMMGTFMMMMIPRSAVCADRIMEVLDTDSTSVPAPDDPVDRPARARHARASSGVEFSYPGADAPVLRDLIVPRPSPARRSPSSARPAPARAPWSTSCPRLFDVTAGAVAVGGVDVRRLAPDRLWSVIGLVPQKAYPLQRHGAVQPAARQDRRRPTRSSGQALEIAQADDFVRAMPEGLDAPIAQGGTNVSGGQRQRLAIARAVVRRPEIYLFDDSFSALDLATDARLRAALRPVTRDATVAARRPAGLHDPRRRPDPRARGRRGRRPRHPPRAARRLPDVPGDRRLPAERGGGGMTDQTRTTAPPVS